MVIKIKNFLSSGYYVVVMSALIILTILNGIENYQLNKSYDQMSDTLIASQKTLLKVQDAYELQQELIGELLIKLKGNN